MGREKCSGPRPTTRLQPYHVETDMIKNVQLHSIERTMSWSLLAGPMCWSLLAGPMSHHQLYSPSYTSSK